MTPRAGADSQGNLPTGLGADSIGGRVLMAKPRLPVRGTALHNLRKMPSLLAAKFCRSMGNQRSAFYLLPDFVDGVAGHLDDGYSSLSMLSNWS
jgi:hypothetical protein